MFPNDAATLAEAAGGGEVVGIGADLEPGTLLSAYRSGLFPMPARGRAVAWWSPDPRGVVPLGPGHGPAGQSLLAKVVWPLRDPGQHGL